MERLRAAIEDNVRRALAEDVGDGDLTASLIAAERRGHARIICRQDAVLCGTAWADEVFRQLDGQVRLHWHAQDGDTLVPDQIVCDLDGPAHRLLTGERTALNFLQTLSGTATLTRRFVNAMAGTSARLLDTRKTLPGLRLAQKYAVRCGGGHNHRMGLYDAVLIKENHIEAAGSISAAVQQARQRYPQAPLVLEIESLEQLPEALASGAPRLLLDNMTPPQLREAVRLAAGRAQLEASGGITLHTIRAIAETGVDFLSLGTLTKDVSAVDFSLRFMPVRDGRESVGS